MLVKKYRFFLKPYFTGLVISMLGLTFRFKVFIRVRGLGYKAYVLNSGNTINLKLGFSHLVKFNFFRGMFATKLGQKDRMFSVEGNN
jgi:ribosomal protein L6P/L9E